MSDDSRNTAYAHNTRAVPIAINDRQIDSRWHSKVRSLVQRDYSFLGYRYAPGGKLYRGMRNGLAEILAGGAWMPSIDDGPLAALERELGVFLFSHELSDALSVSRLWEQNEDSAILVFDTAEFDARWQNGAAAILGFAEPGVIFKYPFFAEPLALNAHKLIVTQATIPALDTSTLQPPAQLLGQRAAMEDWLAGALQSRACQPAQPIETKRFPTVRAI